MINKTILAWGDKYVYMQQLVSNWWRKCIVWSILIIICIPFTQTLNIVNTLYIYWYEMERLVPNTLQLASFWPVSTSFKYIFCLFFPRSPPDMSDPSKLKLIWHIKYIIPKRQWHIKISFFHQSICRICYKWKPIFKFIVGEREKERAGERKKEEEREREYDPNEAIFQSAH